MRSRFIAALVALTFASAPVLSQGVGGISPRAFGAKSWRENGLAPGSLPLTGNAVWDVRLATDLHLYVWNGTAWTDLTSVGGEGPAGPQGPAGTAATIVVGSTSTGAPGTLASVANTGTSTAAVFAFVIPRGDIGPAGADGAEGQDGADGQDGLAAAISVGTVTTGVPGSSVSVTNTGNSSAAVLDFAIPRGDTGATGPAGETGPTGPAGPVAGSPDQIIFNDAGVPGGDAGLTYAKTTDTLTAGAVRAGAGSGASALGLRIGSSSGFWEVGPGNMLLAANGTNLVEYNYAGSISSMFQFTRGGGASWWVNPVTASATVPSLGPRADDLDTGMGSDGDNILDLTAGGVGSGRVTPTAFAARQKLVTAVQAVTIPDNGNGGTRAAYALTPATSYTALTCADANGCDIALSETSAEAGQIVRVVCVGVNVCGFTDSSGVTELAGAADLGQWDALNLLYASDRWIETGRVDN